MRRKILFFLIIPLLFSYHTPAQNLEKPHNFKGYAVSDSIEYSAETIRYYFNENKLKLETKSDINAFSSNLKSNTVTYYHDHSYVEAAGTEDSTGKKIETPVYTDTAGEKLNGNEIKYNLDSKEGIIISGHTSYDKGFMSAKKIKRVREDTLFVADGSYTTCDKSDPDFYFSGKKMKFIMNDKLIIKPLVAYVQDIPVFWFPFYVFPIAKGRQSGFLTPRYNSSRQDGRYISNVGYYFVGSDYYDYRVAGSLREKNGWLINNWINYNKRYNYSGSVFASYENESKQNTHQWKISGSHGQTISPTLNIAGNIDIQSSSFSRNNSPNLYERMNRNLNSSFRISKRWKESGNSLITYVSNVKNLDTNNRTTVAPSFSFTMPRKLLFGTEKSKEKPRKYTVKASELDKDEISKWYENIYYQFNTNFKNTERKDTKLTNTKNLDLRTSISSSNKFMGWLSTNPSLSINESFNSSDDSLSYKRTDNISFDLSLDSKIYGTFNPSVGNLKSIRHVITPSVSFRYGKRRSYQSDDLEALIQFDKNDEKKGQVKSMNISVRNLFQAKTMDGDKENKLDLFTIDFSSGIDFEKEKKRMSSLTTTFDVKPSKSLQIRMSSSHSFYDRKNNFDLTNPFLDDFNITTNIGLSGKNQGLMSRSTRVNGNRNMGKDVFDTDYDNTGEEETKDEKSSSIPIRMSFSHYYRISRNPTTTGSSNYTTGHNIKPNISISPSKNFTINYDMYYDIRAKSLVYHRLVIRRDLHCWEAYLSWVPSGMQEGFYFKVNIKELPDVKLEKRRGVSRFSG